jgi:hypothetical protein
MMKKTQLKFHKKLIFDLLLICLGIYFFLAFLPFPDPINIDLDPSWQYAISQAAKDELIFGKDIIFTFGSLGYLLDGVPINKNFFFLIITFRWTVYLTLYVITAIKISKLKNKSQKILLTFSVLIPFLLYFPIEYQILFIFILILSFEELAKKSIHFWSIGLGVFAGFCLLTKFTLGIGTLGSLISFLFGNIYTSVKLKSNVKASFFALINSLLAAISISFIFLAPNYYLINLAKILICLALGILASTIYYFIDRQKRLQKIQDSENEAYAEKSLLNRFRVRLLNWWIFYLNYSIGLTLVVIYSYPSLLKYIINSLEVSSGYSSAMSVIGPYQAVWVAISEILLISILIILIIKEGNIGLGLALFLTLYLGFKHGFVRQDGHILIFVSITLFIVTICLAQLRTNHFRKLAYFLNIYVLTLALLFPNIQQMNVEEELGYNPVDFLHPSSVVNKLTSLFNPNYLEAKISAKSNANLEYVKLPENVKSLVQDKSIDIIPWEISLVAANQLNWKPRPIFQSYTAYTSKLDKINFESLSKKPRDYIIYQFGSIDDRHSFFDEPKTFAYVFCNYRPSRKFPDFISPPHPEMKDAKGLLLEKINLNQCLPSLENSRLLSSWGKPISINLEQNSSLITAHIEFSYSTLGKLYKLLYRTPPIMMKVNYQDKTEFQYRIIPENSVNGVIVSHLPRSNEEILSFFQGNLPALVKSFSFNIDPPWLFKPTIEINFSSVSVVKS